MAASSALLRRTGPRRLHAAQHAKLCFFFVFNRKRTRLHGEENSVPRLVDADPRRSRGMRDSGWGSGCVSQGGDSGGASPHSPECDPLFSREHPWSLQGTGLTSGRDIFWKPPGGDTLP